jgi:hypothetical protein
MSGSRGGVTVFQLPNRRIRRDRIVDERGENMGTSRRAGLYSASPLFNDCNSCYYLNPPCLISVNRGSRSDENRRTIVAYTNANNPMGRTVCLPSPTFQLALVLADKMAKFSNFSSLILTYAFGSLAKHEKCGKDNTIIS